MQLKLLNYYKMISNIASNLVGAFVPLIIYNITGSIVLAVSFLAMRSFFRLISLLIFKKIIQRKPELFLFFRLFAMVLYCTCLTFISQQLFVGCVLCALFSGLDQSFNNLSVETLLNYAMSSNMDSKSIGRTRVFEKLGVFAGLIVGGLILDVNVLIVYIMAVLLYLIAILPLFVYYLRNRKKASFNKELVSNAVLKDKDVEHKKGTLKYVFTSVLLCYGVVYAGTASLDIVSGMFNLATMQTGGVSYSLCSMFILTIDLAYCISNIVMSKLDRKYDLLNVVRIACLVECVVLVAITFVNIVPIIFVLFAIFGFACAMISAFILQRFVQKSRILGKSNEALVVREIACVSAYVVLYLIVVVFAVLEVSIRYFFLVSAVTMIISVFLIPYMEERTRKMLVDYVEDNEVNSSINDIQNK